MAQAYNISQVLGLFRRDDPTGTATSVDIHLRDISDDALSNALRKNKHVKKIALHLDCLGNHDAGRDRLLCVIKSLVKLDEVQLIDEVCRTKRRTPPDQVTPFLVAIQKTPRVQTVELSYLQLAGNSLASFVDTATSVTTLKINGCRIKCSEGEERASADALRRNRNIQRLRLQNLDSSAMILLLNSLTSNKSVTELVLSRYSILPDVSSVVGRLLESTTAIQRVKFCGYGFWADHSLQPIAQGLIQSKSVTDVAFTGCTFHSASVVIVLNSIIQSKPNLMSLAFMDCSVYRERELFHAAIFSGLKPRSLLRSFELNDSRNLSNCGFVEARDCRRLLNAVETSPLERFSIGTIGSRESCLELIESIPRMQVRTLEFNLHSDLHYMKMDVIQAVKRNVKLGTVVAKMDDSEDWLDDNDRRKLTSYSSRQEFLDTLIANPTVVPTELWPEALDSFQSTGPDTVFRIFKGLALHLPSPQT
jgi:hypothetical protein